MKRLGRKNRPYYRICAIDGRSPRDGRVLEELGTYDPLIAETHGRTTFDYERIQYWIGVGAQPSHRVGILIKKYGPQGKFAAAQQAAREKLAAPKVVPDAGAPKYVVPEKPKKGEKPAEAPVAAAETKAAEAAPAEPGVVATEPAAEGGGE